LKARIGVRPAKISGTMEPVLHGEMTDDDCNLQRDSEPPVPIGNR
jgi:hypothetical protein